MSRVWNTQASHTVGVAPLGKVTLERFRPFVRVVSANFAIVANVQAVQFVKPIRNWLSVPTQRQILWIVGDVIILIFILWNLYLQLLQLF